MPLGWTKSGKGCSTEERTFQTRGRSARCGRVQPRECTLGAHPLSSCLSLRVDRVRPRFARETARLADDPFDFPPPRVAAIALAT